MSTITAEQRQAEFRVEWDRIQADVRNGKYGDFQLVRTLIVARYQSEHPDCEEIGTSDVNHMIYGYFRGNEETTWAEVWGDLYYYLEG